MYNDFLRVQEMEDERRAKLLEDERRAKRYNDFLEFQDMDNGIDNSLGREREWRKLMGLDKKQFKGHRAAWETSMHRELSKKERLAESAKSGRKDTTLTPDMKEYLRAVLEVLRGEEPEKFELGRELDRYDQLAEDHKRLVEELFGSDEEEARFWEEADERAKQHGIVLAAGDAEEAELLRSHTVVRGVDVGARGPDERTDSRCAEADVGGSCMLPFSGVSLAQALGHGSATRENAEDGEMDEKQEPAPTPAAPVAAAKAALRARVNEMLRAYHEDPQGEARAAFMGFAQIEWWDLIEPDIPAQRRQELAEYWYTLNQLDQVKVVVYGIVEDATQTVLNLLGQSDLAQAGRISREIRANYNHFNSAPTERNKFLFSQELFTLFFQGFTLLNPPPVQPIMGPPSPRSDASSSSEICLTSARKGKPTRRVPGTDKRFTSAESESECSKPAEAQSDFFGSADEDARFWAQVEKDGRRFKAFLSKEEGARYFGLENFDKAFLQELDEETGKDKSFLKQIVEEVEELGKPDELMESWCREATAEGSSAFGDEKEAKGGSEKPEEKMQTAEEARDIIDLTGPARIDIDLTEDKPPMIDLTEEDFGDWEEPPWPDLPLPEPERDPENPEHCTYMTLVWQLRAHFTEEFKQRSTAAWYMAVWRWCKKERIKG